MKADFRISQRSNISSKLSANHKQHMSRAQSRGDIRTMSHENFGHQIHPRLSMDGKEEDGGQRQRIFSHHNKREPPEQKEHLRSINEDMEERLYVSGIEDKQLEATGEGKGAEGD
jgi:hypothetical protein